MCDRNGNGVSTVPSPLPSRPRSTWMAVSRVLRWIEAVLFIGARAAKGYHDERSMGKLGQLMTNSLPRWPHARSLALLVSAALPPGCVNTVSVRVPNPLAHGTVTPNRVPQADLARAENFELPPATF